MDSSWAETFKIPFASTSISNALHCVSGIPLRLNFPSKFFLSYRTLPLEDLERNPASC